MRNGDFAISFTGEILVYGATLRNDEAADAFIRLETGITQSLEEIKLWAEKEIKDSEGRIYTKYDTSLSLKADKAELNSFRDEYDEFNQLVQRDYATQTWTANKINSEVGTIVDGKLTNYSTISQTNSAINAAVRDLNLGQYATTEWTSSQITNSVRNLASKSELTQTASSLSFTIESVDSKVDTAKNTANAAQNAANSAKNITDAFYKFSNESMQLNRRIEIGPVNLIGFEAEGGMSPNTDNVAFWAGGFYTEAVKNMAKIVLRHDGSGYLADRNILWDTDGNTQFTGKITSNNSGNRIIIDPSDRSMKMITSDNKNVAEYIFYESSPEQGARINLNTYRSGKLVAGTTIFGGDIGLWPPEGGMSAFRVTLDTNGKLQFTIDPSRLPTSGTYYGDVYRDGAFLKIKT